ncbi:hypothetical protein L207DRAFT_529046 [Hyaloscypha variabilis F]|uniref:Uncharacterized protein n=1 Tax=Hyaloscypha variabilis (strain UAMH 11265 / GT02V1 / F) TaxID=1149755 RepID=A0A2J6RQD9_HYAVF|nr:hypothetical protein L207DRAFT_529046 [Hyaloscypha variabilis F]
MVLGREEFRLVESNCYSSEEAESNKLAVQLLDVNVLPEQILLFVTLGFCKHGSSSRLNEKGYHVESDKYSCDSFCRCSEGTGVCRGGTKKPSKRPKLNITNTTVDLQTGARTIRVDSAEHRERVSSFRVRAARIAYNVSHAPPMTRTIQKRVR